MGKYIDIISRKTWGHRFGLGWGFRTLPAKYAILHHSVTAAPPVKSTFEQDAAAIRLLDQIGYDRFKYADAGWTRPAGAGISYTWAVPPSGRVFEGHDVRRESSHTRGYNSTGVGIVLIGNYDNDTVTEQQIDAIARLLLEAKANGWILEAKINFNHRDVYATACPGANALGAAAKINARVLEIQKGGTPVDNKGFTTEYIKGIQSALKTLGYYTGDITGNLADVDAAVRKFQGDNKLTVDGLPGNITRGVIEVRLAEHIEREAVEKALADIRISGPDRWTTASAVALATLPSGPGVLIAADSTTDIIVAVTRSRDDVRVLPVRAGVDAPPAATVNAIRKLKPAWIRVIGGDSVVTKACAKALLDLL